MNKKISIGVSDFKEIITENHYYVDKSLFIKDIIEDGAKVILIPRPRRFGKTLNMSMLKYFYEKTEKDNKDLFKSLKISEHKEIMDKQGQYPVIYITFKDEKYSTWEECKNGLEILISKLYKQYSYILNNCDLSDMDRKNFNTILNREGETVELSKSLSSLCEYLYKYNKQKVVIIIDEYDVPIQESYLNAYYDELMKFMRNFLSGGLKDNEYLEKAVLTGILRVARESIFSGLNNLKVCGILNNQYSKYFGFLEEEVEEILKYYNVESELNEIRKWYNGYKFGENIIYNPWSILNYVDNHERGLMPYWVNTSSNNLVKTLLLKGGEQVKKELEDLIKGKELIKRIDENIIMPDIDKGTENVWSFLLFSGYLKVVHQELEMGRVNCSLKIPNLEVNYLYEEIIMNWFKESINSDDFNLMLKSLISGDIETFEEILSDYIIKSSSYFDIGSESERFYHAFVLGILVALKEKYEVKSNRESGYGRYDIMMIPKSSNNPGIIIEFKKVNKRRKETLESAVEKALKQIKDKNYRQELQDRGIQNIMEVGMAFEGKEVLVKKI